VGSGPLKTLGIVTLVRVPPNSPFSLTNLVLSTTRVPWWIYIVGTAVGMLPRTALVVWIASHVEGELTKEAMKQAREPWMLWVSVLAALAVLLTLAHIGNKAIEKVTAQDEEPTTSPTTGPATRGRDGPRAGQPSCSRSSSAASASAR
jgi:uncharacterized membrane protein YdjX (TVP38/TMEM64 family)